MCDLSLRLSSSLSLHSPGILSNVQWSFITDPIGPIFKGVLRLEDRVEDGVDT